MMPEIVNWHITEECNYKCYFCYFRNRSDKGVVKPRLLLRIEEVCRVLDLLYASGVARVNFAGGEPSLVSELPKIIDHGYEIGLEMTMVSNSSGITTAFLEKVSGKLSAIKLSIESASDSVERKMGRGFGSHVHSVLRAAELIKQHNIRLMINTVITSLNYKEDLHDLLKTLQPVRWKVFRILPIDGQNLQEFPSLQVTNEQFSLFVQTHSDIPEMVAEGNDLMTESYAMIDPEGRFFQNSSGRYQRSERILDVGVEVAFSQVSFDFGKYYIREGKNLPTRGDPSV